MTELVADLQVRLDKNSLDDKRRWWEQYLKGQAAFRGVPMGSVRTCVQSWYGEYHLDRILTVDERLDLVDRLIGLRFTEDKLAGIILLTEHLIPEDTLDPVRVLPRFARYFDGGHLADWNVVDWFCVKALWSLVGACGDDCGRSIMQWSTADNLWRARASVVTFANVSSRGEGVFAGFGASLLAASSTLIKRPERFAKTGVGWVLRGLAETQPDSVLRFIDENLADFSIEALRSASRGLSPSVAGELVKRRKSLD